MRKNNDDVLRELNALSVQNKNSEKELSAELKEESFVVREYVNRKFLEIDEKLQKITQNQNTILKKLNKMYPDENKKEMIDLNSAVKGNKPITFVLGNPVIELTEHEHELMVRFGYKHRTYEEAVNGSL